jgi:Spy/CpxP family protein refolding chaperone
MFNKLKLTLAVAVSAVMLAGCGAIAGQADRSAAYEVMGLGTPVSEIAGPGEARIPPQFAKRLNLTEAQQAQMKAIVQKYRSEQKVGDFKARRAQLRALLLADQVDGAALRSFFQAHIAEMEAKAPQRAAMMGELRAVLTDAQRSELVKVIDQEGPKHKAHFEGMHRQFRDALLADLNLTEAQKQKFDALQAKVSAIRADQPGQKVKQAFVRFIQDGDTAAFQATMKANFQGKLPVDELVSVAESLDKGQREKLVNKFERLAQFHRGGHGGWHGHHGG